MSRVEGGFVSGGASGTLVPGMQVTGSGMVVGSGDIVAGGEPRAL